MPNELPKALTNWEREELENASEGMNYEVCDRALAWIDAATALLAEQAAQIVVDGIALEMAREERDQAEAECGRHRARIAELGTKCTELGDAARRAEHQLTAANALLKRRLRPVNKYDDPSDDTEDHLAGQPAAPTRTETQRYAVRGQETVINVATDRAVCQAYSPEFAVQIAEALNSAPTRPCTEAEQEGRAPNLTCAHCMLKGVQCYECWCRGCL
jgi:hypothetical protein